jgi:hypothetical protein
MAGLNAEWMALRITHFGDAKPEADHLDAGETFPELVDKTTKPLYWSNM